MAKATDFKFGVHIAYIIEYYPLAQNYVTGGKTLSRGYILNLGIIVNNSETAKATGVLFSVWTNCKD